MAQCERTKKRATRERLSRRAGRTHTYARTHAHTYCRKDDVYFHAQSCLSVGSVKSFACTCLLTRSLAAGTPVQSIAAGRQAHISVRLFVSMACGLRPAARGFFRRPVGRSTLTLAALAFALASSKFKRRAWMGRWADIGLATVWYGMVWYGMVGVYDRLLRCDRHCTHSRRAQHPGGNVCVSVRSWGRHRHSRYLEYCHARK
ncbi:hypothetical protein BZA05DRAFT_247967 [Tricharina praecox]|uniref:uncharacterized protein n=1 Tax=Tricharina praecox TaxID=43433 RepID=UPI00221FA50D|nr:uncharacterized protein BZA05DRAFT_247967 [Tricharina praecox]KAI5854708.1 hypothetical protein BZA05DRAFT_247967 [Tricharina praecox]